MPAGLGLSTFIESLLQNEFDRALQATARALVTLTAQEAGEVELDFADEFMPEFEDPERPAYFQLSLGDGTVVERSRSLRGLNLPRRAADSEEPRFRNLRLPDGRQGRLIEIHFVPQIADEDDLDEDDLDEDPTRGRPRCGGTGDGDPGRRPGS